MYKDSSYRSSPQPPPSPSDTNDVAEVDVVATSAPESATTVTRTQTTVPFTTAATLDDVDDAFSSNSPSRSSSSSSGLEHETHSRPSTTSTTSSTPSVLATTATAHQRNRRLDVNADVRLLRKIGYIASRVRFLSKLYGDFKLVNPYSPSKQRRLLREIILKHSIHDPAREKAASTHSLATISSKASSYCCLPAESSCEDDTTSTTVRRKSSVSLSNSILLLEDLLVQFYEDRRNKITVIRRRSSRRNSTIAAAQSGQRKHLIIMSGKTSSSSVERLLQSNNEHVLDDTEVIAQNSFIANITTAKSSQNLQSAQSQAQQPPTQPQLQHQRSNVFLQPSLSGDDTLRRQRRASDCSQPLANQLQITLKNSNCTKFPYHRGSCGAAGEHLLAANSIANRSTIILSKSCNNVDGSATGNSIPASAANVGSNVALYASGDLRNVGGSGTGANGGGAGGGRGNGGATPTPANANNEYSIVQLNNTIIQCQFNDEDFRALVKDLRRKVEYTERMNWLCLSKRPLAPPNRKSSLPKHQEVKKRFLEICDTAFSDEVKAALRLPAFDSYEWSDADVIHLMQTMFIELGFIEKFSIPVETLREWLYEVYKHYNEVPFHNFRHCFCVAQMMYAITRQANLLQRLGDLECLILLVSCICHDLDHPGYNNIYQINARTELALRYNDISPLENHHCSIAFRLLEHPECNIFKNFGRDTFNEIREGIIRCILATDMARHNEILTQFKEVTPIFDYNNRSHINLLCMILIKVADISNEARPMDVAEPWLDRLLQEFFAQSAAEKSEGLPVTPFMDPDKVSKPGSQVRFIGLVLLPLFEALGDLVPEVTELIIIPVRVALDYYKRLNDAQSKSRKSVADSATASENNSGTSDGTAATSGGSSTIIAATAGGGVGSAHGGSSGAGGGNSGGSISPQMPRSQSGISVKSRRSIPSQKSASRQSVDETQCIAAELHDLPEGSESGDSETATEVDVAEKTSKFKVDTEGSSNRSKSSHSTSRKSSREKRPSMIGEICSSGGGQRIRSSYGNIHGNHSNRGHFGSNRAVSLDQYSTNARRLSDGLQQVISDSNVFYNRHNRGSLETGAAGCRLIEDMNMNATAINNVTQSAALYVNTSHNVRNIESKLSQGALASNPGTAVVTHQPNVISNASFNGNLSPTLPKQHCCAAAAAAAALASTNSISNGISSSTAASATANTSKASWKARLKQFSDYFSFSFDKNSKRFGSTRSSPCSVRNNNASVTAPIAGAAIDPITGKPSSICCTISNNLQSPGLRHKLSAHQELKSGGRHRAYSLDVPCSRGNPRYSSSSGGGGDSSRKSSRMDGGTGDDNNSNNTLHSSGGAGSEMPTCLPPPIRIGSVDASDTILITTGLPRVITPANLGEVEASLSIDLGGGSACSDPPKI